jgi:hypothetical protein
MTTMATDAQVVARALREDPALDLLKAYNRVWVIPLFAEHLWHVDGSVSPEWFHERVTEAIATAKEDLERKTEVTAGEYCQDWVTRRWLDTEVIDGRTRYLLSSSSLRVLEFVSGLVDAESSVSGARLGSLADAVKRLADMVNPEQSAQRARLQNDIRELQRRLKAVEAGEGPASSVEEMREQLTEVLSLTRSLPADFRMLRLSIQDRHKTIARQALTDPPKADLVEGYLHEHDLLASTREGTAYKRFARILSHSEEAETIQRDTDQILETQFAREHMSRSQRRQLDSMFSTLLAAEFQVQEANVRWTGSLRRVLTRTASSENARLLSLISRALDAGAHWCAQDPGPRRLPDGTDLLGLGKAEVVDVTQLRTWTRSNAATVSITTSRASGQLPAAERAAMRLSHHTSGPVVAKSVNKLLVERGAVTAEDVFEASPEEFRRLGLAVTLLDLAARFGRVNTSALQSVELAGARRAPLEVVLPHLVFDQPIPVAQRRTSA